MSGETVLPGRRERKRQITRLVIFEAARDLFYEHPFESVTVQQIAERADLSVGTLFYHAPTKTEMLLMVFNVMLEHAITEGESSEAALPASAGAATRAMALIRPVAGLTDGAHSENLARYHRDLLFGSSMGPHRREGVSLVRRLQGDLARALCSEVDCDPRSQLASRAARAIVAALHFDIAMPRTDLIAEGFSIDGGEPLLTAQVEIIVRGFTATAEECSSPRDASQDPAPRLPPHDTDDPSPLRTERC